MNNYGFDFTPVLSRGSHGTPEQGACVMEMVSFLSGDIWTDTPKCSLDEISHVAQIVNDSLEDSERHLILSQFHRLFGTSKIAEEVYLSEAFDLGHMEILKRWYGLHVPEDDESRYFWERAQNVFEFDPHAAVLYGYALRVVNDLVLFLTAEEKVKFLAEVLDLADGLLGRDEVVPVDTSRISEIPSVLERI